MYLDDYKIIMLPEGPEQKDRYFIYANRRDRSLNKCSDTF